MRLESIKRKKYGSFDKIPPFPSRRGFLFNALALPVALFISPPKVFAKSNVIIIRLWSSENTTLYPFTLSNGLLYLNGDAATEALDIHTGNKVWTNNLDFDAVFRPRLSGEVVISSGRTQLQAWDKLNGTLSWSYAGAAELGVPHVYEGRVYFGDGHRLNSLDASSGEPIWSFDTDKSARIGYAPTASDGIIYLGAGDGVLYALSAGTGQLLWETDREADWQYLRQLAVTGDVLIAGGYHDEIFGIDKINGNILWRFNAGNFVNSQLVAGGQVFFWSPTGWVYALDTSTGKVLWRHQTMDYSNPGKKSNWAPIMAEMLSDQNHLYVLAMDHVLHVLNIKTGLQVKQYRMPVPMRPFMTREEGSNRFLLSSEDGKVYYMELV